MITELKLPEVEARLDRLEILLKEVRQMAIKSTLESDGQKIVQIKDIIGKNGLMSAPTFYKHVKSGKITLLKLGGRSYVKQEDFYNVFKAIDRSTQKLERAENA
jgi:hypothetical protein